MKLRIRGNSIRLRLLQTEVADLADSSRIAEQIVFGPSQKEKLTYAIQISETDEKVSADFRENEICVKLPRSKALEWIRSEQVGIAADDSDAESTLQITVEKDFVCLTRTDDPDNEDAFPNPDAAEC